MHKSDERTSAGSEKIRTPHKKSSPIEPVRKVVCWFDFHIIYIFFFIIFVILFGKVVAVALPESVSQSMKKCCIGYWWEDAQAGRNDKNLLASSKPIQTPISTWLFQPYLISMRAIYGESLPGFDNTAE